MVANVAGEGATLIQQLSPAPNYPVSILMDDSLHTLGLSLRVVNALENAKGVADKNGNVNQVYTVGQLLELTPNDILSIANLGDKTLNEIFRCLAKRGYVRPGELPPPPNMLERIEQAQQQRRMQLRAALAYR